MSINWTHLLFNASGRINRAKWWLTILVIFVIELVVDILSRVVPEGGAGIAVGILSLLAMVAVIWISIAAGIKRLHDLDRAGAWLVLFYLVPVLLGIALVVAVVINIGVGDLASLNEGEIVRRLTDEAFWRSLGVVVLAFVIPTVVLTIWQLIWLGCLPGTPGPNRFGADPRPGQAVPSQSRPM
jgi:uncharacterized membrane protein YhaH (DUF805 family)